MLSGEIARRHGHAGLKLGSVRARFKGSAGQSFAAFLARGVELELTGDANDYVGKSLSGGTAIVRAPPESEARPGGQHHRRQHRALRGHRRRGLFRRRRRRTIRRAQQRRGGRGRGRRGDHCCEYMTGGVVVVLGATGRNFAAGMSGGMAYVWDLGRSLRERPVQQGDGRTLARPSRSNNGRR